MPINICCTQYVNEGCIHPSVPKDRFGRNTACIEVFPLKSGDPRIGVVDKCKIRVPFQRPNPPPGPPNRIVGSKI